MMVDANQQWTTLDNEGFITVTRHRKGKATEEQRRNSHHESATNATDAAISKQFDRHGDHFDSEIQIPPGPTRAPNPSNDAQPQPNPQALDNEVDDVSLPDLETDTSLLLGGGDIPITAERHTSHLSAPRHHQLRGLITTPGDLL